MRSPPVASRRSFLRGLLEPELIPDPGGLVGLAVILGVVASHLAIAAGPQTHLFSDWLPLEILGHAWLLVGPPLSLYLGLRSLVVSRDSLVPYLSLPLATLVTVVTSASLWLVLLGG